MNKTFWLFRTLTALSFVGALSTTAVARAETAAFDPSCARALTVAQTSTANRYLEATIRGLEEMRGPTGLLHDAVRLTKTETGDVESSVLNPRTSPTNVAVDLLVQLELRQVPAYRKAASRRLSRVVDALSRLDFHKTTGLFFSRYSAEDASVQDYAVSSIDNFHLALALWAVAETRPETSVGRKARALFQRMDFSVFYDVKSGLIGGNLRYENGRWMREEYNFANFGSEARALYSAGFALGLFRKFKFDETFIRHAFRSLDVEIGHSSRGDFLKLWDGAAFQLYFPKIFVGEESYSARMKALFLTAAEQMIDEGKGRNLDMPAAHSPGWVSLENGGSYRDKAGSRQWVCSDNADLHDSRFCEAWDATVTPYAMMMAASSHPHLFLDLFTNLERRSDGPIHFFEPSRGWMDGLHVAGPDKGRIVPAQLALNQGMIALALLQMKSADKKSASARALWNQPEARTRLKAFYRFFDAIP